MRLLEVKPLTLFLYLILFIPGSGQSTDRGLRGGYPIIASEGKVYVGTPRGLRCYDVNEDDWMVIPLPGGEEGNQINLLGVHQSILWVGTNGGVANADLRLGDWVLHDSTAGLIDNRVHSLGFEEDYVWVGTRTGASRFDELSQEWWSYGEEDGLAGWVNDIAVDGRTVWFATDGGVVEWDSEFEAWRPHKEAPPPMNQWVESILATRDYVWFFGRNGVGRFNKVLRSWNIYTEEEGLKGNQVNDLALEGDSIWMVTPDGVSVYDPESDRWDDFREQRHLPSRDVRSAVVTSEEVWFGTAEGVARYDRRSRDWRIFSVAEGMSSPQVMSMHLYGDILFVTTEEAVDYFKLSEERWYSVDVSPLELKRSGFFSLGEGEGARLQLSPQLGVALRGRATYQVERVDDESPETETRSDLRLITDLPGERTVYGFYNDTDPEGVKYGLKYKGEEGDLLQEAALGDVRCDLGRVELIQSLGLYGGGVKLGWGRRDATVGERQVRLTGWTGDRTTGWETDLFVGSKRKHAVEVRDIDYLRGIYYVLDTTSTLLPILPETETVWVDDGDQENNTPNTLEDGEIGGVLGDFDLLIPGEDYILDYGKGALRFASPRSDTDVIAVRYEFSGGGGGRWEGVIQDTTRQGYQLLNHYSLGGAGLIPYSLSVKILDLNGVEQPLCDFGLDGNLDGLVDSELVDYQGGVLHFSHLRPFPEEVYLPSAPTHLYTIHVEYETRSPLFHLSHQRLMRESEVVLVDGQPLRRGEDYVLDYTSGYLLMLREELIGERSDVEVRYEYWTEPGEGFGSVAAEVGLHRNLRAGVRGIQFEEESTDTTSENIKLLDASGELRFSLAGLGLILPLELAHSTGPDEKGQAYRSEVLVSSERLRVRGAHEVWEEGYNSLLTRRSKLGLLTRRSLVSAEYHLTHYLPVSLSWKSQFSAPGDSGIGGKEESLQGMVLLSKKDLPVLGISSQINSTTTFVSSSRRRTLRGNLEWELPKGLLPLRALKVSSYLSRTWEEEGAEEPTSQEGVYDAGLARMRVSPIREVEVGLSYRHQRSRKLALEQTESEPRYGANELILSSRCDRVPGLSLLLRGEGSVGEEFLPEGGRTRDLSLERRKELGLEVYPGVWTRRLNPLSVQLNASSNWSGYLVGVGRSLSLGESFWDEPASDEVVTHSRGSQQSISGELRPMTTLILSSAYQKLWDEQKELGTTLRRLTEVYTNRLEVRPRFRSTLRAELNLEEEETVEVRKMMRTLPLIRWEERWGENLLSKLSLSYSRVSSQEGEIEGLTTSITPGLGVTLRYERLWLLGGVNLSNDLSVSWVDNDTWTGESSTTTYSTQLRIELRPVKVVRFRTRVALSYENGSPSVAYHVQPSALSSTLSLRLSAQL